jgi:hypothetical protein
MAMPPRPDAGAARRTGGVVWAGAAGRGWAGAAVVGAGGFDCGAGFDCDAGACPPIAVAVAAIRTKLNETPVFMAVITSEIRHPGAVAIRGGTIPAVAVRGHIILDTSVERDSHD